MTLAALKTALLWLALAIFAVVAVLFASFWVREWWADVRLRRQSRTKFAGQTIAREYRYYEEPSWMRLLPRFHRELLAERLQEIGE